MSDGQLLMVFAGILLQLLVTVIGGLGLAFKIWGWIGGLAERIARLEGPTGQRKDQGGGYVQLRRQKR